VGPSRVASRPAPASQSEGRLLFCGPAGTVREIVDVYQYLEM